MRIIEHKRVQQSFILLGIIAGVYLGIRYVLPVMIPFFIAFLLTALLNPLVSWLQMKVRLPRAIGAFVCLGLFALVVGAVAGAICYGLGCQTTHLVSCYPFYWEKIYCYLCQMCTNMDCLLKLQNGSTMGWISVRVGTIVDQGMQNVMTLATRNGAQLFQTGSKWIIMLIITGALCVTMLRTYPERKSWFGKTIGKVLFGEEIRAGKDRLCKTIRNYAKAEGVIFCVIAIICCIAFAVVRNPYYLIWGFVTAGIDLLPVLGSSLILIPWMIWYVLQGAYWKAVIFAVAYGSCVMARQLIEPGIVGRGFGISTVAMLSMMYIGYVLFGIWGFLLGPLGYYLVRVLYARAFP